MASFDELINKPKRKRRDPVELDSWLMKSLDDSLSEEGRPPRKGVFYPTALGSRCDRYLYNCFHGLVKPEIISGNTQRIFDNGNYLGERYDVYFKKMRCLLQTEAPLTSTNPPISGRLDFLIQHPKYGPTIVELKSINDNGFERLTRPKPEHFIQIQIYLAIAKRDYGIVLYENKNTQNVKAFLVPRSEEEWNEIVERCQFIMNLDSQPIVCKGYKFCACQREWTNDNL